jgi:ribosomal protein S18 acetylase RimI-like enzyme
MTPHEAAQRLDHVVTEYVLRWMRRLPDVTVTAFGRAEAIRTPGAPDVDFLNTVHRLEPRDADQVPAIVAHYREAGARPWFELLPDPEFGRLADALHDEGARHTSFFVVLERDLPAPAPGAMPAGVAIEEVGPTSEEFARVLPEGHGVPGEHLAGAVARTREQARIEGARRYVATVDGEPAAAAVLFAVDGIAYLANASTLERFRRRGCQGALIERRLADAAAAGLPRACVLTGWGSQSHANLARAGFRTACLKAVWELSESTATPPE